MGVPSNPKLVTVKKRTVVFPTICPHCLKLATVNMGIQSDEKLAGYYVLFTRWKYSAIRVPFCAAFAKRMHRTYVACISVAFGLIAAYIVSIFATGRVVEGNEAAIVFLIFIGLFWLPSLIVRTETHIKLLNSADDCIQFEVRDLTYAKMLAELNGETPPENCGDPKNEDDGQSFAA